jgi:hypothetical protein
MSMENAARRRWIAVGLVALIGCAVFMFWTTPRPQPKAPVPHADAISAPPSPTVEPSTPFAKTAPATTDAIGVADPVADRVDNEQERPDGSTATGTVAGHVLLGETPLAGATIVLSTTDPLQVVNEQRSDERGAFRFEHVPAGILDLQGEYLAGPLERPLRIHQEVVIEPGKTTHATLGFPGAPSALEGYVTLHGVAVPEAQMTFAMVDDATENYFGVSTDAEGFYRVDNVMPGAVWFDVAVESQGSGTRKQRVVVDVPPGTIVRQDVAFEGTASGYGVVEGLRSGEVGEVLLVPAAYAVDVRDLASLDAVRDVAVAIAPVQSDGTYRLEPIEEGDYTAVTIVYVQEPPPDARFEERVTMAAKPVHVVEGEETRIDLQI